MKKSEFIKKPNNSASNPGPIIIAGPCSAESSEQVMETAKALAVTGKVDFFRAGVWKPRTSPGSFEGMGSKALQWLQDVKKETGLAVGTEAGSVTHAHQAMLHDLDMLWIGARTVSNPFLVQEIADLLKGTDIVVMVKNPMAPDVDLWEGSIRRFQQAGIRNIYAIHRGFSYWTRSLFRNHPWWHLPMELKQRMPEVPVISDPSHIAGDRKLVPMLAQRAMEMGFSGLMIEVHPDPDKAMSDALQQLTPKAFQCLMKRILGRGINGHGGTKSMLKELRAEVDILDEVLVWALTNRMKLAAEIAGVKARNNMEVLQPERWREVIDKVVSMAKKGGLRDTFVEKLFDDIHHESIALQQLEPRNIEINR